jgi:hypothetical protein
LERAEKKAPGPVCHPLGRVIKKGFIYNKLWLCPALTELARMLDEEELKTGLLQKERRALGEDPCQHSLSTF